MANMIQTNQVWAEVFNDGEVEITSETRELEVAEGEIVALRALLTMQDDMASFRGMATVIAAKDYSQDIYRELTCWEDDYLDPVRVAEELWHFNFFVEGVEYRLWCTNHDLKSIFPWVEKVYKGEQIERGMAPGAVEFVITKVLDCGNGRREDIGLDEKDRASILATIKEDYIPLFTKVMKSI